MTLCLDAEIVGPWVCARTGGQWVPNSARAIGKVKDGALHAGVLYEDYNGANIVCHIAGDGNWATREYLSVIFDYPMNYLNVKRITVPVASDNEKSINLVTRMGFTLECTLAQATPTADMLIYRMFKHECRYIRGKYARS